ncbi:hypothetical protein, partial [Anaeromassilibacillus sp. SJQ-1]|uniref:hypothetical protein n=1 Tax=Anaeromassilibacillus sp. SJQ-1 TaxID=3375419 RepID=UPI003989DAA2
AGAFCSGTPVYLIHKGKGKLFKLLKESWLSLTLVLVILATVCTATFAWREDLDKVSLTAKSVLLNAKMDLANNAESDLGVLNLAALQDGQTAYIRFQMENYSNIPSAVSFRVSSEGRER